MVLLLAASIAACAGPTSDSTAGADLCSAIRGLAANRDDFRVVLTGTAPAEAYAAIDRMSARVTTSVKALRAIADNRLAPIANELASIEEGLIPIFGQIRSATDEAGWTTFTSAYTAWYQNASGRIPALATRLEQAGVHCA
jgi:hypothetical protein